MVSRLPADDRGLPRAEPWRIELLGGIRARRGRLVVTEFRTRRAAHLLARLALNARPHSRDELIAMLWPQSAPASGRQNLSQSLSELRRRLENSHRCEFLLASRETVWLERELLSTDVDDFEQALAAAHAAHGADRIGHLERAVGIASAPLLPDVPYDWASASRERISAECDMALEELAHHYEQNGDLVDAFECAWRRVRIDPMDEGAHREFARLFERAGRPAAGLRHLLDLEHELSRRGSGEPDAATRALADVLRARLAELVGALR